MTLLKVYLVFLYLGYSITLFYYFKKFHFVCLFINLDHFLKEKKTFKKIVQINYHSLHPMLQRMQFYHHENLNEHMLHFKDYLTVYSYVHLQSLVH